MQLPNGYTAIKNATSDGTFVSLIGVIITASEPCMTKGKDWKLEFHIQDDFTGLGGAASSINCRVFWPLNILPKITGPGDIVLLRKFKLSNWGMRLDCVGCARTRSEMLVFHASTIPVLELSHSYQTGGQNTRRLPCKATSGARDHTAQEQMAIIQLKHEASGSLQQIKQHATTIVPKAPAKDKLSLIKDLDFDRFYDVRVQVVNTFYTINNSFELKVTDYTENKNLFFYADPAEEDAYMITNQDWTGPYGQLTLNVILYGNNVTWVRENVTVGDFIYLKNMRTKESPAMKLEGVIHEDRMRPNQVDVRKLLNRSDIEEINRRREVYEKGRGTKSALQVLQDVSKNSNEKPASKKALKKQKLREQKEAELKEIEEKAEEWAVARSGVNKNIRAAYPEMKLSTISEIIYTPHRQMRSQKYHDYTLPFVNAKHRTRVRVVDIFPPELELFAHSSSDRKWNKRPKKKESNNGHTKERWEWGFVLLLEDANVPPGTVSEKLRVVVGNDVGQGLLNQNALDLKSNPRVLKQLEEKLFILWGNLLELKTELRDRGSDLPLPPGDNRLQNKPFDCCIEEYGHEVPITDAHPFGYQRMHKLAQTFIGT